ncbi:Tenascin [Hondaea fermentalgiana]|uniref:Tenascin n=1 Tax=Hondaea fermentalgiana TaxID=2315210 RepID=A0A2R5GIT2_9STRA|nr:Tenascin [Hondaea fermentalgiana]|eukprot:GBG28563.1 Tenascin [Hondaea fermentalgiana]
MACPNNCNNHGQCVSLKDAARLKDDRNFFREVTYATSWEATRIYGCMCEPGWYGYDCSKKECPRGDDPMTTGQVDEVQVIDCTCSNTCSGNFYLSFKGEVAGPISFDDSAANVQAALEATLQIHGVTVAFTGGTAVCDDDGVSTAITFTHNPGDLPQLRVAKNDLTTSGATTTIEIVHSGQTSAQGVASVTGTKEDLPCNGRGVCDSSTGQCTCYTGFSSSDRAGASGLSGDCGFGTTTSCPGSTSCSGHGTCSGASDYTCTCMDGYVGADCNTRTCPTGKAWFAEAGVSLPGFVSVTNGATSVTTTDDLRTHVKRGDTVVINGETLTVSTSTGDTFDATTLPLASAYQGSTVTYVEAAARPEIAHHVGTQCSGRGHCDSLLGTCSCMNGFTGSACQHTTCPSSCSGRGDCISNERFAEETLDNFDSTAYTYGADIGNQDTWDSDMLFGCKCDKKLQYDYGMYDSFGHDCSKLSCPTGDDPSTSGVHESQVITCSATGGTFTLTFRREVTAAIDHNAAAADIKSALEALRTIGTVSVTYDSGTEACSSGGVAMTITFLTELGDLPELVPDSSSLTGGSASATVTSTTDGTRENDECSNHGLCDRATGACSCFAGYVSSDGSGNAGDRGDCGARDALWTGS